MKRRVFNILAALSLVLAITFGGVWVYSSGVYYRPLPPLAVCYESSNILCQINSGVGDVHSIIVWGKWGQGRGSGLSFERHYLGGNYSHGWGLRGLGFTLVYLHSPFRGGDYIVAPHLALVLPCWFLILVSLALPLRWLLIAFRRRRSKGLCPACGYDLRASKNECPECGAAIKQKQHEVEYD